MKNKIPENINRDRVMQRNMQFLKDFQEFYKKNQNTFACVDDLDLIEDVKEFLKKVQWKYDAKIEYKYPIHGTELSRGVGDLRISLWDGTIIVIEVKIISGRTPSKLPRRILRKSVIEKAQYYAKATKMEYPTHFVIPVSITEEKIMIHDPTPLQKTYPWD